MATYEHILSMISKEVPTLNIDPCSANLQSRFHPDSIPDPRYLCRTRTLKLQPLHACVHCVFTVCPVFVHRSSTVRPPFVHRSSTVRPPFVHRSSTVCPPFVRCPAAGCSIFTVFACLFSVCSQFVRVPSIYHV